MAKEIERKFLVKDLSVLNGRVGELIVQGYVAKESGAMSVRVRIRGDRAFLTLKSARRGCVRDEFEYPIPVADAREILSTQCGRRIVRKIRYLVPHEQHVFEIDVFQGRHAGLVVAEVELAHERTSLSLPSWLGDEVTDDPRYGNFTLSLIEGSGPRLPASAGHALGH